jgi:hypothetical protein
LLQQLRKPGIFRTKVEGMTSISHYQILNFKTMAAKQRGDRQLKGSIGGVTYQRRKDGSYIAYEKVESPAKKIASHPNYLMTRQNFAEFGRAGRAGKLTRDAIRSVMKLAGDGGSIPRLLTAFLKIVKADPVNDRGERTVSAGPIGMLEGFDFNITAPLSIVMATPFTTTVDRVAGTVKVDIPGFIPGQFIKSPNGATHFKIIAAALELNFDEGKFSSNAKSSADLFCGNDPLPAISLETAFPANSHFPLFVLVGIEFRQLINGKYYPITAGSSTALKLVSVDAV